MGGERLLITLAVDTSETRGSVAVLRNGVTVAVRRHEGDLDYSEWLLPKVEEILAESGIEMEEVELLAVATGPGSFTGLRVGLTTVKAWAEVYRKTVVGVSRLEAMARTLALKKGSGLVAASYDARRGQIFGGLYRRARERTAVVGEEMVSSPEEFLARIEKEAGEERVNWVSLDPGLITSLEGWMRRMGRGDCIETCAPELAPTIGLLGEERANRGELSDPMALDANYVRRADAEIFWKGR